MKRLWIVSFACLLLVCSGFAQAQEIAVSLKLDKEVNGPTPVCVPLTLSADQAKLSVVSSGKILGQLTAPGLSTEQIKPDDKVSKGVRRDLHFILSDKAAAGATLSLKFTPAPLGGDRVEFNFKDKKGEYCDLCFGDRPILRYMYKAYDASTGDIRLKTYKPFHHVFDPTGKQIVTNGGFTDEREKGKNLTFPHHRGLMLGFMRISYDDGKKMDSWHCPNDNHQLHEGFLSSETGPVLGRQRIANVWYAAKKEPVVREERELTVYNVPGGTLIEFASLLKADHGKVTLNGDPQHAGFQFRAHNDVASNTKETYYVRPDGKGQLGEDAQFSEGDDRFALGCAELCAQGPTLHGLLSRSAEESSPGSLQRTNLWPIRLLFRSRHHAGPVGAARLPHLAAAGRNDRRAGAGPGRSLCVASRDREVTKRCRWRRAMASALPALLLTARKVSSFKGSNFIPRRVRRLRQERST